MIKQEKLREMELEQGIIHVICHQCPMGLLCPDADMAASRKSENWTSEEEPQYLENARKRMAITTRRCSLKPFFDKLLQESTGDTP